MDKEKLKELAQYAKDSDGSAKVALIALDRSIGAWGIIGRRFPTFRSHDVPAILTHLERLRRSVVKGAFQMNCSWYMKPCNHAPDPHTHKVDEILGFFGSNPEDPYDLGAEIEF